MTCNIALEVRYLPSLAGQRLCDEVGGDDAEWPVSGWGRSELDVSQHSVAFGYGGWYDASLRVHVMASFSEELFASGDAERKKKQ